MKKRLNWRRQRRQHRHLGLHQFPYLAIPVSPRLEVENSGRAWLYGCNFQQKQPLPPMKYQQHHPARTDDSESADENIDDAGNSQ